MTSLPVQAIEAEIHEVERLLTQIPEDAAIDRFSFKQRLDHLRAELAYLQRPGKAPERLRLTFRGAPVSDSRGIHADFSGKVSTAFSDAFSAILAGLNNNLNYMGPIPDRSRHPLLITGTAVGSFGFEIELPVDDDLFAEYSGADDAIELFRNLLRTSAEGTDDEIAEIVQEIHPRAVKKVVDFLEVQHLNNAWCGIEFRGDYFKYSNLGQLEISENRLREDNINEGNETFRGEFLGILPQSRTFEFQVLNEETILKGKIDREIEEPSVLNRDWLHKLVTATFSVVRVGNGRPKYALKSLESLSRS